MADWIRHDDGGLFHAASSTYGGIHYSAGHCDEHRAVHSHHESPRI